MTSLFDSQSKHTLSVHGEVIPELMGQPALVAVSLQGEEGVDSLFDYQIILKTPSALRHLISTTSNFDTTAWLGRALSVQIQLAGSGRDNIGAGVREINGIISDARQLRVQDRHAYYSVQLKPWLHAATMMTDCRIFQDRNVKQVIEAVLGELPYTIEWRLFDTYPARDYTTQFNESSFDFVSRLCQTWGISYFFEHADGQHRLVFTDYMGGFRPNSSAAYQTVLLHSDGGKLDEEHLQHFSISSKLTPGSVTSRDFDYTRPNADLSVHRDDPVDTGRHREHDIFQWHSADSAHLHYVQPQAGPNQDSNIPLNEGDYLARIRLEQWRCEGVRAHAAGHVKGMQAGHSFTLTGHARSSANIDYLILHSTLHISEVAPESQPAGPAGMHHQVQVELELFPLRGAGAYRPPCSTPVPHMFGVESAIVVAPPEQDIWIDHLGRIKVQFHWDRQGQKNQNSSCWVRVASPWAGNQLGAITHPRRGQEVLISFISGNPDLPVCTGRVYNQMNQPPWLTPGNGSLSGLRSRELVKDSGNAAGGRSNHLLLDDSAGQIQAQLKSDHQHSQLSLGFITRVEDYQGRKDERGQGFELRTDGHGALRAGDGLIITTEPRERADGHIKDIRQARQDLVQAHNQHQQYAELAQRLEAQETNADQAEVATRLKQQNEELEGGGEQGQLTAPHLLLSSAADIASTTPLSTHIASGQHTALTSGGHVSLSIGQRFLANARNGIRFLAHQVGIRFIAAAGVIDIKALNDAINMIAKLDIQVTSTSGKIRLYSAKEIEIGAGDSFTVWKPGSITDYSEDRITYANFAPLDPKLMPGAVPLLPDGEICLACMQKVVRDAGAISLIN